MTPESMSLISYVYIYIFIFMCICVYIYMIYIEILATSTLGDKKLLEQCSKSLYHSIESWLVEIGIPPSWIIIIPNRLASIIPELIINQPSCIWYRTHIPMINPIKSLLLMVKSTILSSTNRGSISETPPVGAVGAGRTEGTCQHKVRRHRKLRKWAKTTP